MLKYKDFMLVNIVNHIIENSIEHDSDKSINENSLERNNLKNYMKEFLKIMDLEDKYEVICTNYGYLKFELKKEYKNIK